MNRRRFLTKVATAAFVLAIPPRVVAWALPEDLTALAWLRRWTMQHPGRGPILAGRRLFEAVEGELDACMRFTRSADLDAGITSLLFRGRSLQLREDWDDWRVEAGL